MFAFEVRKGFAVAFKLALLLIGIDVLLLAAQPEYPSVHIFVAGLLICSLLLVAGLLPVANAGALVFAWLDRLSLAANLKENIDLPREARRINLLRITLGAVYLWRWAWLLPLALVTQHDYHSQLTAFFAMIAGICLTIGFLTPLASIALMLGAVWSFDYTFSAGTLATHVLEMGNLPLLLFPAGTALSVDAVLMRSQGVPGSAVRGLYGLFGTPTMARSRVGRLLGAASYGGLCLFSVSRHLDDSAWLTGYANVQVLTSFYLSQYPAFFQWLYQAHPALMILLSKTSIYLVMIWEMFFFVFLFFKFTRFYVLFIGAIFITVSGFILQLSYLPWTECVLFLLIFWQEWWLNADGRRSLAVFFDDRCRLCDGTMRFLSKVDLFGIVRPRGLSRSREEVAAAGLTETEVMDNLCGQDDHSSGKLYCGYDLYLELTRRVLLLTPAWPLLLIGKFTGLGPLVYRMIASRRRRVFGTCSPSTITEEDFRPTDVAGIASVPGHAVWPSAFTLVYLLLFVCYVFGTLPFTESLLARYSATAHLYRAGFDFGLVPINVFNKQDLKLESNFVTIEARRPEAPDREFLLPYLDRNGRRLAWHHSDRFYYGNSLPLRRRMVAFQNYCFYDPEGNLNLFGPLLELASSEGYTAPFRVTYYSFRGWDYARIADPTYKSFVPYKVCEITLDQAGKVESRTDFVTENIPDVK